MRPTSFFNQLMDALGRVDRAAAPRRVEPPAASLPHDEPSEVEAGSPPADATAPALSWAQARGVSFDDSLSQFAAAARLVGLRDVYSRPEKDAWDKFKILAGAVVIPIAVAVIAATVSYREQLVSERQAEALRVDAERQVLARAEDARRQEAVSQAQLASALLPRITGADPQERRAALEVLSFVSPPLAEKLASNLMNQAQSPSERRFAGTLAEASRRSVQMAELTRQSEIARQYCSLELHAQSVRTYFKAYDAAPDDVKKRLADEVHKARALYDADEFRAGCVGLEPAFAGVLRQ